ncbi:MAG: ABC transporter ATP-binding protein [Chloroflexi bacterium]|nr:ABC transporter ATP-binding protein [Chloroflexota bacterium]
MPELLRLEKIQKTFPGVLANDNVDLTIQRGEIHALLGENGAGKTTLMNCVFGVYRPTRGQIYWKGQPVEIHQAHDAIALGMGMVHQHFMLIPQLTVAENVILGLKSPREPFLNLKAVARQILETGQRFHLKVDPHAPVWSLPVGAQQRVEVLKVLYRQAELLILDEPTAVLTPGEVEELFTVLKELARAGLSIIFITHKLEEVMAICDQVTVLRDGCVVASGPVAQTTPQDLARSMVGREVSLNLHKPPAQPGEVILSVQNLSALGNRGLPALNNISFEVRAGEILGVAGVDGNGQTELGDVIAGLRRAASGSITIAGRNTLNRPPREILDLNVAYIPPDRQRTGLLMELPLAENLVAKTITRPPFSRHGFLHPAEINRFAAQAASEYEINPPQASLPVRLLSGGNQQKVVLAREVSRHPRLLIASQPTRGLDIGASEYVHRQMLAAREAGAAILLISTDLEEILSLSDRIAVLYEGQIMGILAAGDAQVHEIGEMMAGVRRQPLHTGQPGGQIAA